MHERFRTIRSNGALWWSKRSRAQKIACVIVFIVVLVTIFRHRDPLSGATIDTAKVQTLEKTVRASGTVTSATDLNLSFQTADLVTSVKVRVGDKVKKGQVLATLASNEETATLTKANAVLLSAQAAYTKVLEGASDEEVRVAQVAYDSAVTVQNNLVENARRNLYSDDLVAIPKGITSATSPTPIISGTYNGATPGSYYLRFGASLNTVIVRGLESDEFSRDTDPSSMGVLGLRVFFPDGGYGTNDNWEIVIPNTDGAHYTTNLNAYNTALSNRDAAIAQAQATLDLKKQLRENPMLTRRMQQYFLHKEIAILLRQIMRKKLFGHQQTAQLPVSILKLAISRQSELQ